MLQARDNFRGGQLGAIDTVSDLIKVGKKTGSVVIPPRYGKTDVSRALAYELYHDGVVATTIHLSPATYLANQVNEGRLEFKARYLPSKPFPGDRIHARQDGWTVQGEVFLSLTTQAATRREDGSPKWFLRNVARIRDKNPGKPVLVVIDEGHMFGESKTWGNFVDLAVEAGCVCWSFTGTPFRDDDCEIKGFDYEVVNQETITRWAVKTDRDEDSGEVKRLLQEIEEKKDHRVYKADFHVPLSQAFNENVLSQLSFLTIASSWSTYLGEQKIEDKVALDSLPLEKQRELLRGATQDPRVIREGCEIFLSGWRQGQGGMILTNADRSKNGNNDEHAMLVMGILRETARDKGIPLTVDVATQNTEDRQRGESGGGSVLKALKSGAIDVVIVKQMGAIGFDCHHLKHLLDLSTIDTVAGKLQAWLRVANAGEPGRIITIGTRPRMNIWEEYLQPNIDEMKAAVSLQTVAADIVSETEIPEASDTPEKTKPSHVLEEVGPGSAEDRAGNRFDFSDESYAEALRMKERLPESTAGRTVEEIAAEIERNSPPSSEPMDDGPGVGEIDGIRVAIGGMVAKVMTRILKRLSLDYKPYYGQTISALWNVLRRRFGINGELRTVRDLSKLRSLRDYLESQVGGPIDDLLVEAVRSKADA